ncbi:MAG TPA: serine/threonine-protein kinase [Gemmataceae bacterium]|nr:serine/threonine-protein kinase [Gemmataceae bacterium]
MNEETLFHLALEMPAGERGAFLERTDGGDGALRRRVEALLHAHENPGGFLQGPALASGATVGPHPAPSEETAGAGRPDGEAPEPGDRVGAYKLLQKLGEGGMGTVWVAEQAEPVRRRVALKLIKPGMGSTKILRRFEAERQALALMDHTNIARALDAGTTAEGRPFFVMELVKGVPITKYCDELQLSVRERLALFVPVCQAIQHAHQKGVIHRDVKPSNVLVSVQDGRPVPKVIDFGVAKALHQPLTDQSLYTEVGQVVGTLEYMAPEQAELSALDVDTRADVYGLGVLLYELLTGTTPLDRKWLRRAAYAEVLRRVRDSEPPRPSTRLSESKETLANAAARRRTGPAQLAKEVRGDLDWIVMKCLEKDRTRRYETASALARDVERYLADEPVEACPPGAGYRLRKLLRKHRTAVGTAAAFVLLLLAGVAVSAALAVRATEAEGRALDKERLAREERDAKEAALRQAEAAQRKQADAVAGLLESVFRGLDPRDPGQGLKGELVSRLDRVAADLEKEYAGEPLLLARMRSALGETQLGLGEPAKAVPLLSQALEARQALLGPDHPDTLESLSKLGRASQAAGQWKRAVELHQEALEKSQAVLGPDNPATLKCMSALAGVYRSTGRLAEAQALSAQALARQEAKLGPDHPDTLATLTDLALTYLATGQHAKALPALERVLAGRTRKLGPDHPDTLESMSELANAYLATGQLARALALLEQALAKETKTLGADHPYTLNTMNNLASAYQAAGQSGRGLPLLEQVLGKRKAKFGADHPDTLVTMRSLAAAYYGAGQKDRAVALWEEAAVGMKRMLGTAHPNTLHCLSNLAVAYRDGGQADKALPLFEQVVQGYTARLGPDHSITLRARESLPAAYLAAKRPEQALRLYRSDLLVLRKRPGPEGPDLAAYLTQVGADLVKYDQPAEAEKFLREGLALRVKGRPDTWAAFHTKALLGGALLGQGKYAEAEPLLLEGYEGMNKKGPKAAPAAPLRLTEALERLVRLYEATGRKDKADEWRKKLEEAKAGQKKPAP